MKHIKYLKYVIKHKWFVFIECCKRGIVWRGIIHDLSKFLPSEWFCYVEYFYGDGSSLDVGWLHHQRRNKHHWQYWLLYEDEDDGDVNFKCIEMPKKYAKEMLCDWIGAGIAITGRKDIVSWYEKNKSNMALHPNTRSYIDFEIRKEKIYGLSRN